ncbi:hypothetical protein [Edwardsiella tarda]|uniref:Uncharacterized protein n=1 Tax=Edwardsiella tarda TaxID=636 RepID=A0A2A7U792_EDWTA|nr:hypothetical protein [Edwardsiella tarda]PEH74276.1 hypothetical protein CRM76_01140 [Edwardsiella tarda]
MKIESIIYINNNRVNAKENITFGKFADMKLRPALVAYTKVNTTENAAFKAHRNALTASKNEKIAVTDGAISKSETNALNTVRKHARDKGETIVSIATFVMKTVKLPVHVIITNKGAYAHGAEIIVSNTKETHGDSVKQRRKIFDGRVVSFETKHGSAIRMNFNAYEFAPVDLSGIEDDADYQALADAVAAAPVVTVASDKDQEIATLKARVAELETENAALREEVANLKETAPVAVETVSVVEETKAIDSDADELEMLLNMAPATPAVVEEVTAVVVEEVKEETVKVIEDTVEVKETRDARIASLFGNYYRGESVPADLWYDLMRNQMPTYWKRYVTPATGEAMSDYYFDAHMTDRDAWVLNDGEVEEECVYLSMFA